MHKRTHTLAHTYVYVQVGVVRAAGAWQARSQGAQAVQATQPPA